MRINLHMLLIIGWLGTGMALYAQGGNAGKHSIEAGGGINLSYFDVGGGSPGVSFSGSMLFGITSNWLLGPEVGFHHMRGKDKGSPNEARAYAYKSNIFEIKLKGMYVIRFNRYPYKPWKRKLRPRIFAGLGILQVQPVQNQQLTAGSTEEHLPVAPVFYGGFGLEYALTNRCSLVLEGGSSLSTSDYLEGYTNLENSSANDMFHSMLIKLTYYISNGWN